MELIAIVSLLIMQFVIFASVILFMHADYSRVINEKDWYIDSLEEEIEILEDYIERNEEKWKN